VTDRTLLDAGFIVAVASAFDRDHQRCLAVLERLSDDLLTVEGALVEAAWLLLKVPRGPRTAVQMVLEAGALIATPSEARLHRALELMDQYHDVPMDFVDAQLVALAEEERVHRILTLDRRGFLTYRIRGRKRFAVLPD
jgi:predicted nucleic acid-binding protein